MRSRIFVGLGVAVALAALACGNDSPASPTPPSAAGSTINIVGSTGSQAFAPNPGDAAAGSTVAWRNSDSVTHHIVMNDGSLDTGPIAPGQTSRVLTMATNGGNYHCTIHPTMVGAIRASTGQPPPCTGVYC